MQARLTLRVEFADDTRIGPGKIRLLELVRETGSIAAAGRAMHMSYRRAWLLVDSLNRSFRKPVVETQPGGRRGGGARLTSMGQTLVKEYRAMEQEAAQASRGRLRRLARSLADASRRQSNRQSARRS
jgi:molybdate transport system regulatory protein